MARMAAAELVTTPRKFSALTSVVHGRDALRAFQVDRLAGRDDVAYAPEEFVDAENGVAFVRVLQTVPRYDR